MAVTELCIVDALWDLDELLCSSETSYLTDFVPRQRNDCVGVLDEMVLDDMEVDQFLPVVEVRESDRHVNDLCVGCAVLPPSDVPPHLVRHPDVLTEEQDSVPSTEAKERRQLSIRHKWARLQRIEGGERLDAVMDALIGNSGFALGRNRHAMPHPTQVRCDRSDGLLRTAEVGEGVAVACEQQPHTPSRRRQRPSPMNNLPSRWTSPSTRDGGAIPGRQE